MTVGCPLRARWTTWKFITGLVVCLALHSVPALAQTPLPETPAPTPIGNLADEISPADQIDAVFSNDPGSCLDPCILPERGPCIDGCDSICDSTGPWGKLATSPYLTGDWFGARTSLGEHGIGFDADATLFYMGVVDGGLDREFRFSGHNDYVINMDASKLGGPQGLFVKLRAEHRYGESMSGATGALLPSNISADLPVADSDDIYLTNVLFTQMLSESFGVFFGKLDTLDGDVNDFAHGRGKTQFSNIGFVVTPIGLRTIVYSTLGAGFVILKEGEPIFTFTVLNAEDTAKTSGFENLFGEGLVLIPELRIPTNFFGMPGHQLFGATWSNRNFGSLDQNPLVILPQVPIAREDGSWALYWNFDQHLYVDPCDSTRGWGVFGRAGIADPETNPIAWYLSFGVGGSSMIKGREADTFGAGWYYAGASNEVAPFLVGLLGGIDDGQGVELYYDIAVTPWFHLTPDVQFIVPSRTAVDTATLLGLRARVIF